MTMGPFDDLARALATPMPRRGVLRTIAAALATAAFGAFRPTPVYAAACEPRVCPTPKEKFCCVPVGDYDGFHSTGCCGEPGREDCCIGSNGQDPPLPTTWCCPKGKCAASQRGPGGPCGGPDDCNQDKNELPCGKRCCKLDVGEFCASAEHSLCCKAGEKPCLSGHLGICCRADQSLCWDATHVDCCNATLTCSDKPGTNPVRRVCMCKPGTTVCGADCCTKDQTCSNYKCCPKGQVDCGGQCCPKADCSNGKCCPQGKVNCGSECCEKSRCCETSAASANKVCCKEGESCGGIVGAPGNKNCCPTARVVVTASGAPVCCPTGTVDNGHGACCPPDKPNCCGGAGELATPCAKGTICSKGECVPI
jgi:hypothetical protein